MRLDEVTKNERAYDKGMQHWAIGTEILNIQEGEG